MAGAAAERVRVGLLVALQVVPAREHDPAVAVHDRGKIARGVGVHLEHHAGLGVQVPQAGVGGEHVVLVQQWVDTAARARPVGDKQDVIVGAVGGHEVVIAGRLVGHGRDDDRVGDVGETAHLVQLPDWADDLAGADGRADDHAEERLAAVPIHSRVAHGNAFCACQNTRAAVAGGGGQVFQAAVGVTNPQVAAARRAAHAAFLVAKGRGHRLKISLGGHLGDEQDWVRQRWAGGRQRHGTQRRRGLGGQIGRADQRGHEQSSDPHIPKTCSQRHRNLVR